MFSTKWKSETHKKGPVRARKRQLHVWMVTRNTSSKSGRNQGKSISHPIQSGKFIEIVVFYKKESCSASQQKHANVERQARWEELKKLLFFETKSKKLGIRQDAKAMSNHIFLSKPFHMPYGETLSVQRISKFLIHMGTVSSAPFLCSIVAFPANLLRQNEHLTNKN